ncbi:Cleavage polyadenylation factor subunit Fip1 [Malassezia pachydermatis]
MVPPTRAVSFAPAAASPKPAVGKSSVAPEEASTVLTASTMTVSAAPAAPAVVAEVSQRPPPSPKPDAGPSTSLTTPKPDPATGDVRYSLEELPPEGPPTAAPSTAPDLHLEPSEDALVYPPTEPLYDARTEEEKTQDAPPMTIYQVDINSLPEKPWRRPGANMSDWFNYGFDEQTWALWCAKMTMMTQTQEELAAQVPPSAAPTFLPSGEPAPPAPQEAAPSMPDFSAMFGPGGMMGMQPWPAMMGMMPTEDMPQMDMASMPMPPGMPPMPMPQKEMDPPQNDDIPAPPPGEENDDEPYEPYEPSLPAESGPGEAQRFDKQGRSRHPPHDGRSSLRVGTTSGSRRSGQANEGSDTALRNERQRRYNDRDPSQGTGDALDYGAHAHEEPRRARHNLPPKPVDEDRYEPEAFGRGSSHRDRDRPSRRERERARHDRRSGRGGQKRGASEGSADEARASTAKRRHGGT